MQVDTKKLVEAIRLHRRIRKNRTYSYIANKAIQNVVGHAFKPTPKADAGRIAWQMGQVATKIGFVDRRGNWKRYKTPRRVYEFEGSFAARIINKRRRDAGKEMLFGKEMDSAARRMVGARLRSVAFIKSGWIPAFSQLSRLVGRAIRLKPDGKVVGVDKGWAQPAPKGTEVAVASAFNNAKGAGRVGIAALQASVNYVAADMIRWATDELRKGAREAGFRVR